MYRGEVLAPNSRPATETASVADLELTREPEWYAVHTYPRHEQKVAKDLIDRGVEVFLPLVRETHRWSDRRKLIELPLFSCYNFVHLPYNAGNHIRVVTTPGVLRFVSFSGRPAPIPDSQIDAVRKVLARNLPVSPHCFLRIGQRVRIRGGSLDGVEGILTACNGSRRLVVSIEAIQQSLALSLEGYSVQPI